jgi:hypothetical protein
VQRLTGGSATSHLGRWDVAGGNAEYHSIFYKCIVLVSTFAQKTAKISGARLCHLGDIGLGWRCGSQKFSVDPLLVHRAFYKNKVPGRSFHYYSLGHE